MNKKELQQNISDLREIVKIGERAIEKLHTRINVLEIENQKLQTEIEKLAKAE